MSPKDPFSAKYCRRFQDEGNSLSALKSSWFFMGRKLKRDGKDVLLVQGKVLTD